MFFGFTQHIPQKAGWISSKNAIRRSFYPKSTNRKDVNYAVDAGLYAELVKNRSFEYGTEAANGAYHGWINSNADVLEFTVTDGSADHTGLNDNNPSYATLTNSSTDFAGIGNVGYLDGLAVMEGEAYTCSLFIKGNNYEGDVRIAIEDSDGNVYAEDTVSGVTGDVQQMFATNAGTTYLDARTVISSSSW